MPIPALSCVSNPHCRKASSSNIPKDHAVFEVVESLSRCAKWSVKTDFDCMLLAGLLGNVSQFIGPVTISFNVNLHPVVDAGRNCERVPLPARQLRYLDKDILPGFVIPGSFVGYMDSEHSSLVI